MATRLWMPHGPVVTSHQSMAELQPTDRRHHVLTTSGLRTHLSVGRINTHNQDDNAIGGLSILDYHLI